MTNNKQKLYDFIAEALSHIIDNTEEIDFVKYSCISKKTVTQVLTSIRVLIPELFIPNCSETTFKTVRTISESDLTDSLLGHLYDLYQEYKNQKSINSIIILSQLIDKSLFGILQDEIQVLCTDDFSSVLNTNREYTKIGLLPRCHCIWERSNRLAHRYNRIDNILNNFLILENSILGELIDFHIYIDSERLSHFNRDGSLNIAATPLSLKSNFKFDTYIRDDINYFYPHHIPEMNSDRLELVFSKILEAGKHDSDIILFPELCGYQGIQKDICDKIQALSANDQENLPGLIILPTFSSNKIKSNNLVVIDKHGQVISSQTKQNPFTLPLNGENILEDITPNNVVPIIHIEGIGRIAILICKDMLITRYVEQLLRCFKITLLLVPSYSSGSFDFTLSQDLCANDDCNVVWINSCGAYNMGKASNFKHIGSVRKRISADMDDSHKMTKMKPCPGLFEGKCNEACLYYDTITGTK